MVLGENAGSGPSQGVGAAILIDGDRGCNHHGCTTDTRDRWGGWANALTLVRTVAAVVLSLSATIVNPAWPWLLTALAVYWIGDFADGLLARLTNTETRTGAVFDILADRLS